MLTGVKYRKHLGQHFLRDTGIAKKIIDSMEINSDDIILEIGPGDGALTVFLLNSLAEKVICVETDSRLIEILKKKFGGEKRFFLVGEDILKFDFSSISLSGRKIRVVGNIPYYITTPILFYLLDNRANIRDLTVTVQKEVGERLVSLHGYKTYGIPSVMFQLNGKIDKLFTISRRSFYPVPKVDSVVIRISFFQLPLYEVKDEVFFKDFIRTVFGQRRKMLRNTVKRLLKDKTRISMLSEDLSRRPEELSVQQLVQLSNKLVNL